MSQEVVGIGQAGWIKVLTFIIHATLGPPGGLDRDLCTLGRINITGMEGHSLVSSDCGMKKESVNFTFK